MIGKISGLLDYRGTDYALIDVRGVGYMVYLSERNMAALPRAGEAVSFYTELVVREDLLQLYGFPSMIEKEWHRLLVTVQGVGAKAAMAILGQLGPEGVGHAIALGDARAIQAAPGVGPKIAQRVVLELKAKAPTIMALGADPRATASSLPDLDAVIESVSADANAAKPSRTRKAPAVSPEAEAARKAASARAAAHAEALSALINLGYGHADAAGAVTRAATDDPEAATSSLIRAALRLLAPSN